MDKLVDAHYFMLPTQGNVYSLNVLNLTSGLTKFIVASLKKKVFSFEYIESTGGAIKPILKEISCTYIPSGADIISIDAFNKSSNIDDFQIGITIIKANPDNTYETYLNIYSEQDLETNYSINIESIAQNCLMVQLNFTPYYLTHTFISDESDDGVVRNEVVWVLSGSDYKVHIFREDRQNHTYNEVDSTVLFPEFKNMPSCVMWIDFYFGENYTRFAAIGCECGTFYLTKVRFRDFVTLMSVQQDVLQGPISRVQLFTLNAKDMRTPEVLTTRKSTDNGGTKKKVESINLLVCSTLDPPHVFMDVGLDLLDKFLLPGMPTYDSCLCACVDDINMDGLNEIILGTCEKNLLMYSWSRYGWKLDSKGITSNPVHAIHYVDIIGDGVRELLVQTISGVHIMQHNPENVQRILRSQFITLMDVKEGVGCEVDVETSPPDEDQEQKNQQPKLKQDLVLNEEEDICEEAYNLFSDC